MSAAPAALVARHVSKRFGSVTALDDASLTVLAAEVHGLAGENGSGKSTLIRILAGYHAPGPGGELEVSGRPVRLPLRPGDSRALGLRFVHQDLGLIPSLSVVENLRITDLAVRRGWRISWAQERRRARETFARFGVELDPGARVADLRPAERALLAILRAVDAMRPGQGLLVLDEPTAFLPKADVEKLFALVRGLRAAGASVLLVSHDLDEVEKIADHVTVLRDGRTVGTVAATEARRGQVVQLVVGGRLGAPVARRRSHTGEKIVASIEQLSGEPVHDLSLDLVGGQVLGLTGLIGSGFEEVPYLLFGARRARDGRLTLAARSYDLAGMTPDRALRAGVALLPADRLRDGCVGSLPVADNVTLPVLDRYAARLHLDRGRLLSDAAALLTAFDVRPGDPRLPYRALSGGNQQKALLAKWLHSRPPLLLLDEPTHGVDVGARQQIFALIRRAVEDGSAVLCSSSDYEQLEAICDRVLVFSGGRIVHELAGEEVTKERIAESNAVSPPRDRGSRPTRAS